MICDMIDKQNDWGEETKHHLRVWKPLPTKDILITLRESPEGKVAVSLGRYKWY